MIPIGKPSISESDIASVSAVLQSGRLTQGQRVEAFEQQLADLLGTGHVVAVSSGTAALLTALVALGVGRGDLVLVSAYSWIATANVAAVIGARPVFIDVERDTLAMDPGHLTETISNLRSAGDLHRVKAIIVVHPFGYVADMRLILEETRPFSIPVIEDAACALGAEFEGERAGTIGEIGCFSFHPLKAITTGEGGALTTNSAGFAQVARAYRNHGQEVTPRGRDFPSPGLNLRMTDFQAALGVSQLSRLDEILAARRNAIEHYLELTARLPLVPQHFDRMRTAAQAMVFLLRDPDIRPRVIQEMRAAGVEVGTGTVAMPFSKFYQTDQRITSYDLPVTYHIGRSALSIPLFTDIDHSQQAYVVEALVRAIEISSRKGSTVDA